jgi:hypothetical protein
MRNPWADRSAHSACDALEANGMSAGLSPARDGRHRGAAYPEALRKAAEASRPEATAMATVVKP